MLSVGNGSQVFLVAGVTDMRKSFDTLAAMVREVIYDNPLSGHLFVFCNRRRDRLKVGASGFCVGNIAPYAPSLMTLPTSPGTSPIHQDET